MLYLTLMDVIFDSKAHSHMSNRRGAPHFAPNIVNPFIVNTNSVTGKQWWRNGAVETPSQLNQISQNDSVIRITAHCQNNVNTNMFEITILPNAMFFGK